MNRYLNKQLSNEYFLFKKGSTFRLLEQDYEFKRLSQPISISTESNNINLKSIDQKPMATQLRVVFQNVGKTNDH